MTDLWGFLLQTLTVSGAAALLLAVKAVFRDKLSPRWQAAAWGVLGLVLLVPAGWGGRYVLINWPWLVETAKTLLTGTYTLTAVSAPIPLPPAAAPRTWADWLYLLYLAGVLALLGRYLVSYIRLRAALRRGQPAGEARTAQIAAAAERYGLTACPAVEVPGLSSAFICGLVHPVLALPAGETDEKVLLHELLHLQYRDVLWGLVLCLARCVHWCNPLLGYCANQAGNDLEALCDQRVLERLEGEDRRDYGRILLSMADEKYARAPGTSSMANGGRNIKARIQAIARFRRYPAGMALASGCVAAVLALTCLGGVSGAAEVPGGTDRGALALAQAQLNRPTTVAGALDTYAKAILCDSPVYFSMVLPEPARELAWQTGLAPYQEVELEDSPFWTLGFHWHRPAWQAEWSVMNLLPDGAGGYTGTLFFSPLSEDNTYGIVYQQVAVRPDGDFWTVEPLGELEALRLPDEGAIPAPDDHIPHITYAAETVDLRLEVDLTYFLTCSDIWVGYMSLSDGGWAGGRTFRIGGGDRPSPVPAPHAAFTSCCKRSELRVERKSGGVPYDFLSTLAVLCVPLSSDGSPAFDSFVLTAYDLPGVSGLWHAAADDSGLEGLSALSLDFVYGNQRYTCTAYPAEVTP